MQVRPQDYWRVMETVTDAHGGLCAYRVACSSVFFDKNHQPLTRSRLVDIVGKDAVDEDYPQTIQNVLKELTASLLKGSPRTL
jgi:hypothetical protein